MIIQTKNPPAGGADGPLECQLLAGVDCSESAPEIAPAQETPQPRRIEVRIAVNAARAPYGRSRIFCLTNHDLERLLAHAESLDRRSS